MPPCEQTCRADAVASTASQPAFVTTAKRPFPGWDVASDSADLPDGLSETFFAEGLDSPNQFEMPAEISLCAHWIFDPIYGNHAPHLASVEEIGRIARAGIVCPHHLKMVWPSAASPAGRTAEPWGSLATRQIIDEDVAAG
jgi:hypothetical protein